MPSEWKEEKLKYKYAELPEEPIRGKKKPKKKTKKSDHKHLYTDCILTIYGYYNDSTLYVRGSYCPICGKLDNVFLQDQFTEYEAEHSGLPFFREKIDFFSKYVPNKQ